MPKVATSHWSYRRYFPPLIRHSIFPPEGSITPVPLTLHKVFPQEKVAEIQAQAPPPSISTATTPSITTVTAPTSLIRKPRGEVSRISRGGYNLQEKLGLPSAEYEEIRSFVIHLAREHLNIRKAWSKQKTDDLNVVFSKAKGRYPQLLQYEGNWVVADFLKIYLKNSSGRGA